jgi:hypothetical protein
LAVIFSLIFCVSTSYVATSGDAFAWAGTAVPEAPQTARQALMEMFFGKTPGTFLKHLPAATRAALEKSGALANLQQYSLLAGQLQAQGKNLQTFEAGPVLLATEDPKTGQKIEVIVASDSLRGDQDDIELWFQTYKDNQAKKSPFMPRIVFAMKMESGAWTLNDIAITIDLPLADPDFLKSVTDGVKAHAAAAATPPTLLQGIPSQNMRQGANASFGGDAGALADVRKIVAAETTYAATYPAVGYTCTLSDLDGFGSAEANEHQAMLISSGLAGGKHHGYSFTLAGCAGSPAGKFQLTAAPVGDSFGRRAFCSDQSGVIRSSADGSAATCLSGGTAVP